MMKIVYKNILCILICIISASLASIITFNISSMGEKT